MFFLFLSCVSVVMLDSAGSFYLGLRRDRLPKAAAPGNAIRLSSGQKQQGSCGSKNCPVPAGWKR